MNVNNPRKIFKFQKFKAFKNNEIIFNAQPNDIKIPSTCLRGRHIDSCELHVNIKSYEDCSNIAKLMNELAPSFRL